MRGRSVARRARALASARAEAGAPRAGPARPWLNSGRRSRLTHTDAVGRAATTFAGRATVLAARAPELRSHSGTPKLRRLRSPAGRNQRPASVDGPGKRR